METGNVNTDGSISTQSSSNVTISSTKKDKNTQSNLDVNDFLSLLVTQMQYQDPLQPSDNTEYISQMATFSQVEATTQMQNKTSQQMASNLIGKDVMVKSDQSTSGYVSGKVNYWQSIDGKIYLGIEGSLYDIDDLDTVIDEDYYKQYLDIVNGTNANTDSNNGEDSGATEGK